MKRSVQTVLSILIALIFCGMFLSLITVYSRPMEDMTLDLSLLDKNSHISESKNFDSKGWIVYTQDGENVTPLESTGNGSYRGIELGETFYFSRVMSEKLDSPTLQIGTADRMFSVWLDEELIYTDCPELDNRIGYVTLPMNTQTRKENITISLPMNYEGKTLTIAQSTPPYSETPSVKAYPASVTLYCGYAYESGIIAESFSAAIGVTVLFILSLFLLVMFIRGRDIGILGLTLCAFFLMWEILHGVSFFTKYFDTSFINVNRYVRLLSAVTLSAFLTIKAKRIKPLLWSIVGAQGATVLISLTLRPTLEASINKTTIFFEHHLMEWIALLGLLTFLALGIVFFRKENVFYRIFAPLAAAVCLIGWTIILITDPTARTTIPVALVSGQCTMLFQTTYALMMPTAIACAIYEAVKRELARRAEKAELEARRELTLAGYEMMRHQHEDVMKIKHEIVGHLVCLKGLTTEPRAMEYLDHLIGQNEKIHPLVQSGNPMLDIILNSKLSEAKNAGIRVDLVKAEAPEVLPLSDADLCSLVMNIMSNAVNAATAVKAETPYIRLDIHEKNDYFAITCKNSANPPRETSQSKKETVREHGWGSKIIGEIVTKYHGLMEVKQDHDAYEIRVAIPLFQLNS